MARKITVAAAQMGPVHRWNSREEVMDRLIKLLTNAASSGAQLVVFPELTFTTFFPRYLMHDEAELERYFETEVDGDAARSPNMKPLFDKARELKVDISVGFAEHVNDVGHLHYNTAVYYSAKADRIISKYRKVHLPGTVEPWTTPGATQQLEKRYFKPGDLGFKAFRVPGLIDGTAKKGEPTQPGSGDPIVGILICNDRRWAEAWRCYGLQGAELILDGYNTTGYAPDLLGTSRKIMTKEQAKQEALTRSRMVIQSNSYTNACFSINVAKCGYEDNEHCLIGGSCIVDSDGDLVAEATTEEDEIVLAEIDLEECKRGKGKVRASRHPFGGLTRSDCHRSSLSNGIGELSIMASSPIRPAWLSLNFWNRPGSRLDTATIYRIRLIRSVLMFMFYFRFCIHSALHGTSPSFAHRLRSPLFIPCASFPVLPTSICPLPRFKNSPCPFAPTIPPASRSHMTLPLRTVQRGQFSTSCPSKGV